VVKAKEIVLIELGLSRCWAPFFEATIRARPLLTSKKVYSFSIFEYNQKV
jgi:hypothetical protein